MYRHNEQNHNVGGVVYQEANAEAVAGPMRMMGCQKIVKTLAGTWNLIDHTGTTGGTIITAGYYDPPFTVRGFKVEGQAHRLHYDMPFDHGHTDGIRNAECSDLYAVEVVHPVQITRVILDVVTTVDAITLYY
jgi:hypothetical protein